MLNVKAVSFENLDIKSVVILGSSYLFSFLRITLLHVTKSYFYWVITKTWGNWVAHRPGGKNFCFPDLKRDVFGGSTDLRIILFCFANIKQFFRASLKLIKSLGRFYICAPFGLFCCNTLETTFAFSSLLPTWNVILQEGSKYNRDDAF